MSAHDRSNELHREHRAVYLKRQELERRGLDYTDAYARTADEIREIEIELAELFPGK